MRAPMLVVFQIVALGWAAGRVHAQEAKEKPVPCRDIPCVVIVDWSRAGGVAGQVADRRYGNPADLARLVEARLTERGFGNLGGTEETDLRFRLVPVIGNALCDEMAGTSTDWSCRVIRGIEARADGPDDVRRGVDMPSSIQNLCPGPTDARTRRLERRMPIDRLGPFVADWIVYALEGKSKGERRPVARC